MNDFQLLKKANINLKQTKDLLKECDLLEEHTFNSKEKILNILMERNNKDSINLCTELEVDYFEKTNEQIKLLKDFNETLKEIYDKKDELMIILKSSESLLQKGIKRIVKKKNEKRIRKGNKNKRIKGNRRTTKKRVIATISKRANKKDISRYRRRFSD